MGRIWSVLILFILFFLSPVFVQAINGDANLDGRVDGLDYVIWLDNYNQTVTSGQRLGDFDGSGHVDGIDYVIWRNNYLVSPTGSLSPSPANQVSCLDRPGPLLTLNGLQKERFNTKYDHLAAGTRVDARTAVWTAQWPVQDSFNYPVLVGGPGICFSGGTITGSYPEQITSDPHTTWDYMHSTSAMTFYSADPVVENTTITNYGDAINFSSSAENFHVRGVHLENIRDDCIQDDYLYGGLIEDSLLNGCYTGISSRTYDGQDPMPGDSGNNIITIKNSLIRLKPVFGVYKNKGLIPGHGEFFKWDSSGIAPRISLHNNIFRADQPANSSGMGLPEGKLAGCSNNIMVWLGTGGYPDPLPSTFNGQPCFTVTTDISVWNNAITGWLSRH
ncbi:MAG: hypothetical protein UV73_C0016G0015 [Candidatus Gottesmanbacteria bacterium GW2011_GWA2_43_14]|uniref:Pectate lyase C n=1 Tax=Candidatus Gottesmanbacteria bacterium GW2011_GWA2_43_14 TaxID=1618443 RepID=A0A0G1DCY5_9BACT|nr:MAG: hypothetical protein UV73_C0016G0015 [Candidatus Gottesmanbacteria bacterium GW2011_GWA2_43_14]